MATQSKPTNLYQRIVCAMSVTFKKGTHSVILVRFTVPKNNYSPVLLLAKMRTANTISEKTVPTGRYQRVAMLIAIPKE